MTCPIHVHSFVFASKSRRAVLSKREGVGVDAGVEELDRERTIFDRPCLPDELVQACFPDFAPTFGVHVGTVIGAGSSTVDLDAEPDRPALRGWGQDKVKIPCMEAIGDAAGVSCSVANSLPIDQTPPRLHRLGGSDDTDR
jgi:hypothetical protein